MFLEWIVTNRPCFECSGYPYPSAMYLTFYPPWIYLDMGSGGGECLHLNRDVIYFI